MLDESWRKPWTTTALLVACGVLAGCAPKTDVSATGNVPAQYSHVFMSVQEIWFNTSSTATPDDTTWLKFPLDTPVTVDLSAALEGTVSSLTTGLAVPIGTYQQVRLIPVDSGATLISSAQTLGALYNFEADYVDSTNTSREVPLELQNPDKGIGIQTSVEVKGQGTNIFASSSATSTSTTDTTTTPTTTSTSTTATPFSLAINVDGAKDLVPFVYPISSGNVAGMLLNPHVTAYDTSTVGAIQGTLSISGLSNITSASTGSYVDIQVTAETLSTDGSRHIAVNSTPVRSDGTFTLYPLSTSTATQTSYDLVIHGPAIATIVIKSVPVSVGSPSTTTPVSVGTITPRASSSFLVNLSTTTPLQAGALVGFYQTLPGSTEVPYAIELPPIDPFNRNFPSDVSIAVGSNLDTGTFSSSGSDVALSTVTPAEGASTYRVAATAPLFTDGPLTTLVTAPGSANTTTLIAVPALTVATGSVSNTTTFTVAQTTAKKYDKGFVIVSHDGAIVATAALDSVLAGSGTGSLAIAGIPAGLASSVYYVSVRTWNSTNSSTPLNRETYPQALNLSNSSIATYSLQVD